MLSYQKISVLVQTTTVLLLSGVHPTSGLLSLDGSFARDQGLVIGTEKKHTRASSSAVSTLLGSPAGGPAVTFNNMFLDSMSKAGIVL